MIQTVSACDRFKAVHELSVNRLRMEPGTCHPLDGTKLVGYTFSNSACIGQFRDGFNVIWNKPNEPRKLSNYTKLLVTLTTYYINKFFIKLRIEFPTNIYF